MSSYINKKVSIIVPIYNVDKYLVACLDSLLCQSYTNIEIIGVDDASTDSSKKIFQSYCYDKRFKLICNSINMGLPTARNIGLLNATGDYIFFLDSDDWISPYAIEHLMNIMIRDDVDIVIGGVLKYFEENGSYQIPQNHGKCMAKKLIKTSIFDDRVIVNSITSWNKLININFIKSTGLIFSQIPRTYEDILTYKWYLSGAKISNTPLITYYYRQRSSTNNKSILQEHTIDKFINKTLSLIDIIEFMKKKNLFYTTFNPLTCDESMMSLSNNLYYLPRNAFKDFEGDDLIIFVSHYKYLLETLDENFLSAIKLPISNIINIVRQNNLRDAVDQLKNYFKNKK